MRDIILIALEHEAPQMKRWDKTIKIDNKIIARTITNVIFLIFLV